jgi:hypothetical protein
MTTGIKNKKNKLAVLICSVIIANQVYGSNNLAEKNIPLKNNRIPLGNINGSTGNVFKKDMFRIVFKDIYFEANEVYDRNDKTINKMNRKVKVNMALFVARYGLGNGFDVRLVVPYIKKTLTKSTPNNKRVKFTTDGIGDIAIIGRYQLLNQKKGDPFFLSLGMGVKFPTGSTDKKYNTPQGKRIIPQFQNGSGSTDLILEAGISKILPNSRIDLSASYKINGKGDNNYKIGNMFRWNIGYSYALTKKFDLQLEIDGIHKAKNSLKGKKINNSGGDTIYITPGFHYRLTKNFDVSLGYAIPIYRDLNCNNQGVCGLSENKRVILRVGYTF